ncbi:histidine phosphatase family protein [Synechococcus sp. Cruz-9H2]|uniref:histidine phosphatase family protein n=1 Tax=unclassified Synechococcus TaxID=2626047 RepID=UPI0020CDCD45|nr:MULTISPECIES: histidine phosphatase family protein [unclassified Synechococcus]MCP9818222.1 histidine phosphatase family protein [Synechococcus sp. Cruz-9H2]MCP9842278.1 histidine phosphatase family protein [Synechococcus sp. Edmonson 11F2]MCP9854618.1 histidine phosphatase family protein [Synechococcus sp. Cruz-9C9]MCP9861686.1 histidine phosphatase family protein [Synechococcus sp. Cruz-7E5]MCP9869130.1 histidine phosphatase family protein [Synechococcus sp. Cruz-7B9]
MPLRLLLVRHGLSSFNTEHRIQGRDDLSSLTDEGQRQARLTGAALADLRLDAVYSSPLSRAANTAAQLLEAHGGGLGAELDDDLLEVDLAPWCGLLGSEVKERFPEAYRLWREAPDQLELERSDGSRFRPIPELMDQARRWVDRLEREHLDQADQAGDDLNTVLVVAHSAILRCLVLQLLGLPASRFQGLRLDNASLSVFNLQRQASGVQVQIESLNVTAHLGTRLPPKGPGARLLLVRHGETDWNRQGRFQGQIDIPLNSTGLAQARSAADFLSAVPIQKAFTSSMARPRQTAEAILTAHPEVTLHSQEGLVEIGHGRWEGRLEQEISQEWGELLQQWKDAPHTVQMPEGENLQQVWDRSLACWRALAAGLEAGETALVVAHDAVNKTILCALLGLTPADIWMVKQGNGGVSVIDWPPPDSAGGTLPVVTCLNLTTHLGGVIDRTAAGAL